MAIARALLRGVVASLDGCTIEGSQACLNASKAAAALFSTFSESGRSNATQPEFKHAMMLANRPLSILCSTAMNHSADEVSTSYGTSQPWSTGASPMVPIQYCAARGYKKNYVNRPNLAQPLDVNTMDELLERANSPGAAALPVLKFSMHLNPRQTTYMLQKLPRLQTLHRLRYGKSWGMEEQQMYQALMACLQQRFCEVMQDCTPQELQHGLWGLAVAGKGKAGTAEGFRLDGTAIADSLAAWLQTYPLHGRPSSTQTQLLSHAAWYLTASGMGQHAAMATVDKLICRHHKWQGASCMDHRSICRLAWAFSTAAVGSKEAWGIISGDAASSIDALLKANDSSTGPLQPSKQYLYRTIQGWTKLTQPRPYRPSKYLRYNGPRIIVTSFDLSTAASLVHSMARAGHRDATCLKAVEQLVVASLRPAVPTPSLPPTAHGSSSSSIRAMALLPGSPGGLVPTVGGRLVPADPASISMWQLAEGGGLPPASLAAGTARLKIGAADSGVLTKANAIRLLKGFYDLKFRSPKLAETVLANMRFSQFKEHEVGQVASMAYMAAVLGLHDTGLMARLLQAALPLFSVLSQEHAVVLAVACLRVGYWPRDDPATAQLLSRVVGDAASGQLPAGLSKMLRKELEGGRRSELPADAVQQLESTLVQALPAPESK